MRFFVISRIIKDELSVTLLPKISNKIVNSNEGHITTERFKNLVLTEPFLRFL